MGIRSRRLAVYAAIALTAVATPLGIVVGNASAAADPTAGFTPYTSGYKVQNWTSRPLSQTFTITGGVININVRSGERRVEMAWDRWTNQGREHMWSADVLLDAGSTRTAIICVTTAAARSPAPCTASGST